MTVLLPAIFNVQSNCYAQFHHTDDIPLESNQRCNINGLHNPGFENFGNCPNSFSQFNHVNVWFNPVNATLSTPDYFNMTCDFDGFNSNGVIVESSSQTDAIGCGRAGLFLNYFSPPQDPKYREYIAQTVNLSANIQHTLSIDLQRSDHSTTSTLGRDFAIYGYNGSIPASVSAYCINNAVELATINRNSINGNNTTFQVNFTPTQNFDYIIFGASCASNNDASNIGYIFIDNVVLSSSNRNTLTPIFEYFTGATSYNCCFSGIKQDLILSGNQPPSGISIQWGQGIGNPESVTFTAPNNTTTGITETGNFLSGDYQFYYSFTNNGCTISDTLNIVVSQLELEAVVADMPANCLAIQNGPINRLQAMSPTNNYINTNQLVSWWSLIQEDGSQHVFPNGGCYTENDGPLVTYPDGSPRFVFADGSGSCPLFEDVVTSASANGTSPSVEYIMPYDSAYFIWHVQNQNCGFSESSDTMLFVHRHISARDICVIHDFTTGFASTELALNTLDNSHLLDAMPGITITWNYQPDTLIPPVFPNSNVSDSVEVVFQESGIYTFTVEANDGICTWDDEIDVVVYNIYAEAKDSIQCNIENPTNFMKLKAIAPTLNEINTCDLVTWWSFLKEDGNQHIFPNGGCVPDDGRTVNDSNGNIRFFMSGNGHCTLNNETVLTTSLNGTQPQIVFANPYDSINFIWNVQSDLTDITTLRSDTIIMVHRHILVEPIPENLCVNDTVILNLSTSVLDQSYLIPDLPNVNVSWTFASGPATPIIS